eukprot:m.57956 g.57956  ORF g.57956 m.57956 type:complete len:1717 (+) comp11144_c1_seq1:172-5322(+)
MENVTPVVFCLLLLCNTQRLQAMTPKGTPTGSPTGTPPTGSVLPSPTPTGSVLPSPTGAVVNGVCEVKEMDGPSSLKACLADLKGDNPKGIKIISFNFPNPSDSEPTIRIIMDDIYAVQETIIIDGTTQPTWEGHTVGHRKITLVKNETEESKEIKFDVNAPNVTIRGIEFIEVPVFIRERYARIEGCAIKDVQSSAGLTFNEFSLGSYVGGILLDENGNYVEDKELPTDYYDDELYSYMRVEIYDNNACGILASTPNLVVQSADVHDNDCGIDISDDAFEVIIGGMGGEFPRVYIYENKKSAIKVGGDEVQISNVWIGITPDGDIVANEQYGIHIVGSSDDTNIGGHFDIVDHEVSFPREEDLEAADMRNYVGLSCLAGIWNEGDHINIYNTWVGVGPNGEQLSNGNGMEITSAKGIVIGDHRKYGCFDVDDESYYYEDPSECEDDVDFEDLRIVIGFNRGHGLVLDGVEYMVVINTHIGVKSDGITPAGNQQNGIFIDTDSEVVHIGFEEFPRVLISGNGNKDVADPGQGDDVPKEVKDLPINDALKRCQETSYYYNIDTYTWYSHLQVEMDLGIVSFGLAVKVLNAYIGVSIEGEAIPNADGGIYLGENNDITTGFSWSYSWIDNNVISGNGGVGVYCAHPAHIKNNIIGLSIDAKTASNPTKISNLGYGVFVTRNGADSLSNQSGVNETRVENNIIGGNMLLGTRFDVPNIDKWTSERVKKNNIITVDGMENGWGRDGCKMCECDQNTIKTETRAMKCKIPTELQVLKDFNQTGSKLKLMFLEGYGADFPPIPDDVVQIDMYDTKLLYIDWDEIHEDVTLLDFSDNPELDAIYPGGFTSERFPELNTIRMKETDLSNVASNTYAGMGGILFSVDMTEPKNTPPSGTKINMTGLSSMNGVLWFNNACPIGFYDALLDRTRPEAICAKCPEGTQKLTDSKWEGRDACEPCPDGTIDHDDDPTTECISSTILKMVSYERDTSDGSEILPDSLVLELEKTYRYGEVIVHKITGNTTRHISYSLEGAPKTFLMSTEFGLIQATPTSLDEFHMAIYVHDDESGARSLLQNVSVSVQESDLRQASNGPNGKGCENGGKMEDGDLFDGSFSCTCPKDYGGANCETRKFTPSEWAGIASGIALLILFFAFMAQRRYTHYIDTLPTNFEDEIAKLVETGELPEELVVMKKVPREIKRGHLKMMNKIGEGAFGEVWKSLLDESSSGGPPEYLVAAKTVTDAKASPEASQELVAEATLMAQVEHSNLVSIIGVITRGNPMVLVMSFCEHGSLLSLLKRRKDEGDPISRTAKVRLSIEIAMGMGHLHEHAFVHRDLAARNVLVATGMVAKVADFGLSRIVSSNEESADNQYYRSQRGVFPVRWTSPEAMQTLRFTPFSDVWSFGVTMLEIFQDGAPPYAEWPNEAVIALVSGGERAEKPIDCPEEIYNLMLWCWTTQEETRPIFPKIIAALDVFASDEKSNWNEKLLVTRPNIEKASRLSTLEKQASTLYEYNSDSRLTGSNTMNGSNTLNTLTDSQYEYHVDERLTKTGSLVPTENSGFNHYANTPTRAMGADGYVFPGDENPESLFNRYNGVTQKSADGYTFPDNNAPPKNIFNQYNSTPKDSVQRGSSIGANEEPRFTADGYVITDKTPTSAQPANEPRPTDYGSGVQSVFGNYNNNNTKQMQPRPTQRGSKLAETKITAREPPKDAGYYGYETGDNNVVRQ